MQYSYISAALLALVPIVAGQFFDAIQSPERDQVLPAGKAFDLVWNPLDVKGTATIHLLYGASNLTLQDGPIIKAGVDNQAGKFSWKPEDLGYATYGWVITLDSDKTKVQTSSPFRIAKAGGSTVTLQISPGPSYTSTTTPTSSVTVLPATNTSVPTSTLVTPTQGSNLTSTLVVSTTNTPPSPTVGNGGSVPTSTPAPATSSSAAMTNIISGGFAVVGGVLMAFAL